MPNCTKCGTWNPDDKELCWRCQTELPKAPPPKPKRQTYLGFPMWGWIALVLFFAATSVGQCFLSGVPQG
jgi:hypothetical protein